jgi:hypothetical protein
MNKTKESSIAGAERPDKKEKLKRGVKKLGALALSVAVAVGLYHEAHKPAMNSEQMREATNIAATTALDKVNEIKDSNPDLNDNDGSYFIGEGGNMASFYVYDGDPDGDTAKGSGTNVEISITDGKSSGERGVGTSTRFVFSTEDESALDKINADNKVNWSEVKEFLGRPDVNVSRIQSHEDSNRDGEHTPETLKYNVYNGGDDNWGLEVNNKDGASGYEDSDEIGNVFTGDSAVAEVQKAIETVKSNWGDDESKK